MASKIVECAIKGCDELFDAVGHLGNSCTNCKRDEYIKSKGVKKYNCEATKYGRK